jgi:hypothetical protein
LLRRPSARLLTALLGALLVEWLGSPIGLLVVLVITKTAADLALHQSERDKLSESTQQQAFKSP